MLLGEAILAYAVNRQVVRRLRLPFELRAGLNVKFPLLVTGDVIWLVGEHMKLTGRSSGDFGLRLNFVLG